MAKTDVELDVEDDEEQTPSLFPELNMDKDGHKAVLSAAKSLARAKAERAELLGTSKAKVDGKKQKLIGLMHENKLEKFRFNGVKATLVEKMEDVEVTIEIADDPSDE